MSQMKRFFHSCPINQR